MSTLHHQLRARADTLAALPRSAPPAPWIHVATLSVDGITEVGFADSSDQLLVLSDAGRSLVAARTGELIAAHDDDAFDAGNLTAKGLGPFAGKVRMAGLRGGGLPICTADGWGLQRRPLAWPDDELILSPPGQTMLWTPRDQPMQLTRLAGFASEVRAFGFSPTGETFVVATASDLAIFRR